MTLVCPEVIEGHGYGLARTAWSTSFEAGDPAPPAAHDDGLRLTLGGGPAHVPAGRAGVGLTGVRSLCVGGDAEALARGPRRALLADGLDVLVEPGAELRWSVCPVLDDGLTYRSTWVAVDLRLDDGTWLAAFGPRDQYGVAATAQGQGAAKILVPDHWNLVRVDLSAAAGRTVTAVAVVIAPATEIPPGPVESWLDDVAIGVPERRVVRGLVDHVDTRRGTHSTGAYSRGNTVPAAAVPNGAALWVPLTDGASASWLYSWSAHNGPDNRPRLHGVAVSHVPSPWMGDRDQLAVHLVPAAGARADGVPDGSLEARGLAFDHAAELARPHHYGVALDGGSRIDVTPTDHGAVLRLTFPPGDAIGHVVLDAVSTEGAAGPGRPVHLRIEPESGSITGWSDHGSGLSVGRSRMYVVGRLDRPVLRAGRAAGGRPHARYATIDLSAGSGGRTVELRLATSFVGTAQAWRTFARELEGVPFATVEARARAAWEERLGVVEVEGATDDQLTTLYSCLYRLNLYPTSQTEDAGETGRPLPVHASPVLPHAGPSTDERTGAVVVEGEIFVNHGFWDTYRTCWPAYALLHPIFAGRLADGFVQQYREAGWVARWSSPGYADLMTGTSSDVAFADLLARGVRLPDPLAAYDAGLRNATVVPPHAGVGRKGQEHALLHGWVPREVHESVSWSLEGYVNDAGLAAMARQLAVHDGIPERRRRALLDEAAYLERRALGYVHLFDRETGFFRGRGADGAFVDSAEFDPAEWGGDYTESDAWNFAFHVPHDGVGLARLHGGPEGLAAVLERFSATPECADRPGSYGSVIHEMSEARDVRLGQLGQSNQVSHHVPYTWLVAGRPNRAQETVREILRRLWTGSELGQGYHGDEDNGEMSAWYVLSALGLYPLEVGSPRWALGSPLFRRAVVHRPGGDLVLEAPGAEDGHRYVAGVAVDGRELDAPVLDHGELAGGARVRFRMAAEPSGWGAERAADAGPDRLPWRDVSGAGVWRRSGGRAVPRLADDELGKAVEVGPGRLTWSPGAGGHGRLLHAYTLVSAADGRPAPTSWRLSVRTAGGTWRDVDSRVGEEFRWAAQLRPFVLGEPVAFDEVRLDLHDAGALAQVELLVE